MFARSILYTFFESVEFYSMFFYINQIFYYIPNMEANYNNNFIYFLYKIRNASSTKKNN